MKRVTIFTLLFFFPFLLMAAERFPVAETLEPYIKNGELPGVVTIIADKDTVLQIDALGYADIETQRPMNPDTLFWIASQTKPVTAVAVMILVDEGKLSLTEPVTTYLPELADIKVAVKEENRTVLIPVDTPITLDMMLRHTSGYAFRTLFQERHRIDSLPMSKYITSAVMTPLTAQPGTAWQYSQVGINLAGAIVERVAEMPFEDFLEKRLFEPLGMKDTTFFPDAALLERLATTYSFDQAASKLVPSRTDLITYPLDGKDRYAEPGGGLFSTPNDLVKFFQMLQGNGEFNGKRILSESAVKAIQTGQTGVLTVPYGLGVTTSNGMYGHGGALGTDAQVNTNNDRVLLYFIQHQGIAKSEEAKQKFFAIGNRP